MKRVFAVVILLAMTLSLFIGMRNCDGVSSVGALLVLLSLFRLSIVGMFEEFGVFVIETAVVTFCKQRNRINPRFD